jgi:hypothetical protein
MPPSARVEELTQLSVKSALLFIPLPISHVKDSTAIYKTSFQSFIEVALHCSDRRNIVGHPKSLRKHSSCALATPML